MLYSTGCSSTVSRGAPTPSIVVMCFLAIISLIVFGSIIIIIIVIIGAGRRIRLCRMKQMIKHEFSRKPHHTNHPHPQSEHVLRGLPGSLTCSSVI